MTHTNKSTKESSPVALAVTLIAICGSLALGAAALASSDNAGYGGATAYFPDQFVNQGKTVEALPDGYDHFGLPTVFPVEPVEPIVDSTPAMYY